MTNHVSATAIDVDTGWLRSLATITITMSIVIGCTRPTPATNDASASDATSFTPVRTVRWSLARTDDGEICAAADNEPTRCFSPVEETSGRHPRGRGGMRFDKNPYALAPNGAVTVSRGETRETLWREAVVAKLPPATKIVHEMMSSCALTTSGRVLCWPEPRFAHELPHAVDVGEAVTDLFLQSWMTLCVRTASRRVLCSKGHPIALDICSARAEADCGTAVAAHRPPQLGERLGPVRIGLVSLLPKSLETVAEDVDELAPFLHQTAYEQLDGNLFVRSTAPGGCVRKGDELHCFRRAGCRAGRPWVLERVPGLPSKLRKVHLGAARGYALAEDRALFVFDRGSTEVADGPCVDTADGDAGSPIHTERVALRVPVHEVAGGEVWAAALPGHTSADCASLVDGSIWCWSSGERSFGVPKEIDLLALGTAAP